MAQLLSFEWSKPTDGWEIVEIDSELDQVHDEFREHEDPEAPGGKFRARRGWITPRKGTPAATRRLIKRYESDLVSGMRKSPLGPPPRLRMPKLVDRKTFLVPKSDSVTQYKPFELNRAIFMDFANTPESPEGKKAFFDRYGAVLNPSLSATDVEDKQYLKTLRNFREAVSEWQAAKQSGNYQPVIDRFTSPRGIRTANLVLDVTLKMVPGIELPVLRLEPRSLADAMVVQLAKAISGDFDIRQCASCPSWFVYGTGTGRRSSGMYCSDRCKQAAYRRARDKKAEVRSGGE